MTKRGFTLIELTISMAILGTLMAGVMALNTIALKNYTTQSQKSIMQKDLNFLSDNIAKDVKRATLIPPTYGTYSSDATTIVLAIPAINAANEFIYNADLLQKDYIIYYLTGTTLKKRVFSSAPSKLASQDGADYEIAKNVSSLAFTYNPKSAPRQVEALIELSAVANAKTIQAHSKIIANLRNIQ